ISDLLILFLGIIFFSSVIDSARLMVSKAMGREEEVRPIHYTFLLPSIVLVMAIYNAGYGGNSISRPMEATNYDGLMHDMQSGSRQFVIEPKYLITYKADFDHFLGPPSKPFNMAYSIFERFDKLCTDPSLVSAVFTLDLAAVSAIKGLCTLVRIPTPGYTAGLQAFDDNRYYGMVFGRNFSTHKMVEKTNQVLLRYFREEQMFNLWIPRFAKTYVGNIWGDTREQRMQYSYAPFKYGDLDVLMPIIYALYGVSITVFLLEFIGYHSGFPFVRKCLIKLTAAFDYINVMGVK
ncbi:hypothetical protein PMAYCL1PPCAC_21546, partial [Pristionchus mayeri]